MSEPNPVDKDIKKTIDSWLLSLPYKEGDVVKCYYPDGLLQPKELEIEELEISSNCASGVRVQLKGIRTATGTELWLDSDWIEPTRVEVKAAEAEESKAITDTKWIAVDPDNLPEGEVLAISKDRLRPVIGEIKIHKNGGLYCQDDEGHSITPEAYQPLEAVHQLWEGHNPSAGYSKDSDAFKLLEWIIESDSSLGKALEEIPIKAGHTIKILAQQIIKLSRLVEDAPQSPERNSSDFFQELIYWIKDYIAD
jgi:hypothetical protein